nr:hypothetical protein MFMH1_16920 [Myxococcus sp. MH1]
MDDQVLPPESRGVYLVSQLGWKGKPTMGCIPLYFGGNTGSSKRFRTRIGDLIADLHGFYGGGTGHHSGAQALRDWCVSNDVHPGQLFLGWATKKPWCGRCAEVFLAKTFASSWAGRAPLCNVRRPPGCSTHGKYVTG